MAGCMTTDAIVVGSGAAGGWAAKDLTESGLRVVLLEAGPQRRPSSVGGAWATRLWRYARGTQRVQSLHSDYWIKDPSFFVSDAAHPYATPPDRPFVWIRGRQLGGRTLLWGGVSLRLSDYEFSAADYDSFGPSWPIRYRDLAPYYDRVERFLHVYGAPAGLPQLPDGRYVGARPLTLAERRLAEGIAVTWPDRRLIPSRGLTAPRQGSEQLRLSSVGTTIAAAHATGRLRIRTNAVVSHLTPDRRSGGASGVVYFDAATGAVRTIQARIIVLCASTIETVRILLTTAVEYPGLSINESGCLGRFLMDHVVTATAVEIDGVPYETPAPRTGADSFLIPRFQNIASPEQRYQRGFGFWGGIQRIGLSGRRRGPALGLIVAQGEMLPVYKNHVALNEDNRCADGLLPLRIDCAWGDNERVMHAAMREAISEMVYAGGGRIRSLFGALAHLPGPLGLPGRLERFWVAPPPGSFVHEVGGARMGDAPTNSVVDSCNRCWALPNVLVTDGACWPTSGWQSPTLTIMALTARACALAVDGLRR